MRQRFIDRKFRGDTLLVIEKANEIVEEYTAMGFMLTLRQLYYQFVSRALIANKQSEYKRLGSIINDARLAGLIDWNAIEDRTRNLAKPASWDGPEDIIRAASSGYAEDLWNNQPRYVEVWIEKEALVGVVASICDELRVPYFACRGYASQSELFSAGRRLRQKCLRGQKPLILHLGDHDPSGIDMTRDNRERLAMFTGEPVNVRRLALNLKQIEAYNPPPNPAKETDARFSSYEIEYGDESWELDALDPRIIRDLVQEAVDAVLDQDRWQDDLDRETANKGRLEKLEGNWSEVSDFLDKLP